MTKKKAKKKKKEKSLNYKWLVLIGALFHFIVYLLIDITLYSDSIFWWSLIVCGLISGIYLIEKMKLTQADSYKKIAGIKVKLYMFVICFFTIIGTTALFGNVINGAILSLNYIGKSKDVDIVEYRIKEITHNKSTGRNGRKRRFFRRNNPKVFFQKNGELVGVNLSERYNSNKDYSEFNTITFDVNKGLFDFDIIGNYELKK